MNNNSVNNQSDFTPVLACHNLCKTFVDGGLRVEVLKDLNVRINRGETVAIVGASGSGKSTLLQLLGGLDQPSDGEVYVAGENLGKLSEKKRSYLRNRYLGFVYQFHHLLPEFSALENVCMPLFIANMSKAEAIDKAMTIISKVGLAKRYRHKPSELSGGERQRIAIARALVTEPVCVLADEPTGNLDNKTAQQVFDTLLQLNTELQTSIVIVTHDMQLAKRMQRGLNLLESHVETLW